MFINARINCMCRVCRRISDEISPIEVTVLKSLAEGNGLNEITIAMCMSAERVKMHLELARYKLQALNRAHAVAKAFRAGLIG